MNRLWYSPSSLIHNTILFCTALYVNRKCKSSPKNHTHRNLKKFMNHFVLTLIGNAKSAPIESTHLAQVCRNLTTIIQTDWLAEKEACDIFIESPRSSTEIAEQAHEVLSGKAIDAVCTPVNGRRKKILISDMDSTIINQECIDELGEAVGFGSQIREITAALVHGKVSVADAMRQRLAMLKGMEYHLLESVYENRISLKPGAQTLVQTMRHHGAFCILVSGGFTFFTSRIAERIGFHQHQGNELEFEGGKLTGKIPEPLLGRSAKLNTLTSLCAEKGLLSSDVLAVGDGANDIEMIKGAGLGVAFHNSNSLKNYANAYINHSDLTALLYIQGFHKSEFVLS